MRRDIEEFLPDALALERQPLPFPARLTLHALCGRVVSFLAWAAWGMSPLGYWSTPLQVLALVPIVLTPRMIAAFFREVLELDPRHAMGRTVAHQAITWTLFLVLAGSAVALWPRIVAWIA